MLCVNIAFVRPLSRGLNKCNEKVTEELNGVLSNLLTNKIKITEPIELIHFVFFEVVFKSHES